MTIDKKLNYAALGALVYMAMLDAAWAQKPPVTSPLPSAGTILQGNPALNPPDAPRSDERPEVEAPQPDTQSSVPDEPHIHVSRILVDNVPAASKQRVDAIVSPYVDREMTLTDLRNVAVKITEALQDDGEVLSYAYVPQQHAVDNEVHLAVLRGHLESVHLTSNHSLIRDSVLRGYLKAGVAGGGDVRRLQEQLTRLSDLPGIGTVSPVLSKGKTPGGTELNVSAEAGPRVDGVLVADNAGQGTTGRNRIGAQIDVNSPLGLGDRIQLSAFASPDYFQFNHGSDGGHTLTGRISYDLPVGSRGARAGVAVTRVNYAVGGPMYNDTGTAGYAMLYSMYGSYPVIRGNSHNLKVSADFTYKRLADSIIDFPNNRTAETASVYISGDRIGSLGRWRNAIEYQVGVTGGNLHNQLDWNGADTRGKYVKLTENVNLTQLLGNYFYAQVSFSGQQTSRNLDSAEKMTLGGPNAVRAYSMDSWSADRGYLASVNLTARVPAVRGTTVQLFYDYAHADIQKFSRGDATLTMAGYGIGVNCSIGKRVSINVSQAWRARSALGELPKSMTWVTGVLRI